MKGLPLVVISLALVQCEQKVPEPEPPPKPSATVKKEVEAPEPAAVPEPVHDAGKEPTELVIEDIKEGTGPAAKKGDKLSVHYTGTLFKTGAKFDSSRDRSAPFSLTLGAGGVIQGWDEGLVGMKKGGQRKLTIPSDKAYGPAGRPPTIPPNSTLVFDLELVDIR